jgi:hypothetical protein
MAIVSMTVAILMLAALTASAAPKPTKHWNLYQDKLGAYVCTTADPKGQTLIAHPFATQAECLAAMTTPPTIEYALTPASPNGAADWYVSDVSLAWTVTFLPGLDLAPAPVLDGCVDRSITADQPKTTYTCTATTVFGVSAGPVSVDVKRDATKPSITWSGGINDGDSFEVGSVPDEPTIVAEDVMSGVASSGLTGYGQGIGTHTLVATATDVAGNEKVEQRGYTVTAHQATVVDPTVTDEVCASPGNVTLGGITIPTVEGVEYLLEGTSVGGGFVELEPGTFHVTAQAQADYELAGYPPDGWTLEVLAASPVGCIYQVTAAAPTAVDETADASGGITITATDGVDYFIDAVPAAEGFNALAPGTYEVTALARFGYVLVGDINWSLTINAYLIPVAPGGVVEVPQTCAGQVSGINVFANEGVQYTASGYVGGVWTQKFVGNGFTAFDPGQVVTVKVEALPGYELLGADSFGYVWWYPNIPPAPTCGVQFIGRTIGGMTATSLALPAGWQPGDLAVVFVANNMTTQPPLPSGYTNLSNGNETPTGAPDASYRLSYRILAQGDGPASWGTSSRASVLMVYRNARVGNVVGYASKGVSPSYSGVIPAVTLQQPGTSWVGAFAYVDNMAVSNLTIAGLTNRTAGAMPTSMVGGFDTNQAVASFANKTITNVTGGLAAASFELKVMP